MDWETDIINSIVTFLAVNTWNGGFKAEMPTRGACAVNFMRVTVKDPLMETRTILLANCSTAQIWLEDWFVPAQLSCCFTVSPVSGFPLEWLSVVRVCHLRHFALAMTYGAMVLNTSAVQSLYGRYLCTGPTGLFSCSLETRHFLSLRCHTTRVIVIMSWFAAQERCKRAQDAEWRPQDGRRRHVYP